MKFSYLFIIFSVIIFGCSDKAPNQEALELVVMEEENNNIPKELYTIPVPSVDNKHGHE